MSSVTDKDVGHVERLLSTARGAALHVPAADTLDLAARACAHLRALALREGYRDRRAAHYPIAAWSVLDRCGADPSISELAAASAATMLHSFIRRFGDDIPREARRTAHVALAILEEMGGDKR